MDEPRDDERVRVASPATLKKKGWFIAGGRTGDRTLEQQLTGLAPLFETIAGKTVLDAGCAEGLISIALAKAGAAKCHGLELVSGHVQMASDFAAEEGVPCTFEVANLNGYDIGQCEPADIVLMLAILHKLNDPTAVCIELAGRAREKCVIRLPPTGPVIIDDRSGRVPHNIPAAMDRAGFDLMHETLGPFEEWMGYFTRRA